MGAQVWKYALKASHDTEEIEMPIGATPLHVAAVPNTEDLIFMWALVDPDAELVTHKFRVYGTGWDVDLEWPTTMGRYVGTTTNWPFIWHVWREW